MCVASIPFSQIWIERHYALVSTFQNGDWLASKRGDQVRWLIHPTRHTGSKTTKSGWASHSSINPSPFGVFPPPTNKQRNSNPPPSIIHPPHCQSRSRACRLINAHGAHARLVNKDIPKSREKGTQLSRKQKQGTVRSDPIGIGRFWWFVSIFWYRLATQYERAQDNDRD